jgi:cardiolipin synthase
VIVVTRDVIILIGFLMFFLTNHRPKMGPSVVSKITTFLQISTVLLALSRDYALFPPFILTLTLYGVVLFTILSGIHYIYVGTLILSEKRNH